MKGEYGIVRPQSKTIFMYYKVECYEMHFDKMSELVMSVSHDDSFVLAGDYNLGDSVSWELDAARNVYEARDVKGGIPSCLLEMISMCELNQMNVVRNSLGRTLDLFMTNADVSRASVVRSDEPLVPEDGHHPAIQGSVRVSPLKFLREKRPPKTNFFKADYVGLNDEFLRVDWRSELERLDAGGAVKRFYEILGPCVSSIPKVNMSNRDYPVYYTHSLIAMIRQKANAKSSYEREKRASRKEELWAKYSGLRKGVKREISKCFRDYVNDCEEKIKVNAKCFFSFTKSLRKTNSLPGSMKLGSSRGDDGVSICNLFAKFF